jgi:hypothetical protein
MMMKFAEHNFEKASFKVNFKIEQMTFEIDPKQLSDLLDFVKFQNYSVFYGILTILFNYFREILFVFLKDRCREYRQLYLQDLLSHETLTQQQNDRIHVIHFLPI